MIRRRRRSSAAERALAPAGLTAVTVGAGLVGRRLTRSLRESRRQLAEAQRLAGLGSWDWDRDTNRVTASPEMLRMLGGPRHRKGVLLEDVSEWVHPDDRERVVAVIAGAVRTAGSFSIEHRATGPDGEVRVIHARGQPRVDATGRVTGMLGTDHDVTEARAAADAAARLRERLHRSQRLESIGLLAGGIAHDFNNLLGVILNYAALAERDLETKAAARDEVREIKRAAEQAAELTQRLLVFSQRDAPDVREVDLNALLRQSEGTLGGLGDDDLGIELRPGPDLWPVVAHPGQMSQVLVNLALNARDAMPDGGRLTIETANVHLTAKDGELPAGRYVRLTVSDQGEGMAPSVAEHAFEPFFTTKPRGQGTGLGLASVYGIVRRAGGGVELSSRPGRGTTVTVHLPAAERRTGH